MLNHDVGLSVMAQVALRYFAEEADKSDHDDSVAQNPKGVCPGADNGKVIGAERALDG